MFLCNSCVTVKNLTFQIPVYVVDLHSHQEHIIYIDFCCLFPRTSRCCVIEVCVSFFGYVIEVCDSDVSYVINVSGVVHNVFKFLQNLSTLSSLECLAIDHGHQDPTIYS